LAVVARKTRSYIQWQMRQPYAKPEPWELALRAKRSGSRKAAIKPRVLM
jgi:hypothetical protein